MAELSAVATTFIQDSIKKTGISLTTSLEMYLVITFSKYIDKPLHIDLLTINITGAMDSNAPKDVLRSLADQCLIGCALFETRLKRNGIIRHYISLGQTTYDAAGMTEQAYGFIPMMDVLSRTEQISDVHKLLDMAKGGSTKAREQLGNVVLFKKSSTPTFF